MNENNINNLKLLSPDDLAKIFNMSKSSVYRIMDTRKITFYKVGGSIRFKTEDVEKYLEDNKVEIIDRKKY